MANLGGNFDATTVAPAGTRTLVPAGSYPAHTLRTDIVDTDTGGKYIWLEHEITDGDFRGVTIENRLNIVNKGEKAAMTMEIAQRMLSALCHATGEMNVSDTDQFLFKPFLLVVKVRPAVMDQDGNQKYGPQSEVSGYKALTAGAVARPAPVAALARPATPAAPAFGTPAARPAIPPAATIAAKPGAPWGTPRVSP